MLQRVYGTVWPRKEDLERYLWQREEEEKRDHRRLGSELDLFSIQPEVGPGLALFHPKGALVRTLMEDYWRQRHRAGGYDFVVTPTSGGRCSGIRAVTEVVQGWNVRADRHRRRALLPQTDELPVPHAYLQQPDTQLPRAAHALRGARHRVPLRAFRHLARAATRSRLHARRRPPVLQAGSDAGGDRARPGLLPVGPGRLRFHQPGDGAERPRSTYAGKVRWQR